MCKFYTLFDLEFYRGALEGINKDDEIGNHWLSLSMDSLRFSWFIDPEKVVPLAESYWKDFHFVKWADSEQMSQPMDPLELIQMVEALEDYLKI